MPMTVPTWQPAGGLPVPNLSGSGAGISAAQKIYGQGMEQLANTGSDAAAMIAAVRQRERETDEAIKQIEATTQATAEISAAAQELGSDPDYPTAPDRFGEKVGEIGKRYGESITDPKRRALFDQHIGQLQQSHGNDLRNRAIKMRTDRGTAALDQQAAELSRSAAGGNPATAEQARGAYADSLVQMRDAGMISAEEAGKRLRAFDSGVVEARVLSSIRTNPEQAAARLLAGDPEYASLDPVRRERLIERAQTEAETRAADRRAAQARADAQAERFLRQQRDETSKSMRAAHADGTLSRDWLEKNRRNLDATDYGMGLKLLEPGATKDDESAKADIIRALGTEDVRPRILAYQQEGRLTNDTALSYLERNDRMQRDDRPAAPAKRYREWLGGQMAPGPMSFDFDATKRRQSDAFLEFDNWLEANPKATGAEIQDFAFKTANRFNVRALSELPLPRYASGRPKDLATLDAIEAKAYAAYDAKPQGLSRTELDAELRKIEEFRRRLSALQETAK